MTENTDNTSSTGRGRLKRPGCVLSPSEAQHLHLYNGLVTARTGWWPRGCSHQTLSLLPQCPPSGLGSDGHRRDPGAGRAQVVDPCPWHRQPRRWDPSEEGSEPQSASERPRGLSGATQLQVGAFTTGRPESGRSLQRGWGMGVSCLWEEMR